MLTLALLHELRVTGPSTGEQRWGAVSPDGSQVFDFTDNSGGFTLTEVGEERTLRCSQGLLDIYRLTPAELAGAPWMLTARIHGDDRQRVVGLVDNALQAGEAFVVAYRIVRPTGELRL